MEDEQPIAEGPGYVSPRLADLLAVQISDGTIPPDGKLPGQRELAEQHGVAVGTVLRALEDLRERGLIVTWHGRGSYAIGPKTREQQQRRDQ
ncbi:GntR family transcriptional regulator [Jiangella asiatica]|uniref:GntR family transcriptional regulator n=1 Tax=Jiangella asiatica TaxID=2530372 RepID=A0A4R5DG69_9ACTN|nr:winged helix-turn-helix domain-containing protein [Jiangella asiatica]TDE09685.1 GntR family transcriptional regulator [Jiangella asiatica]